MYMYYIFSIKIYKLSTRCRVSHVLQFVYTSDTNFLSAQISRRPKSVYNTISRSIIQGSNYKFGVHD